MVYSLQKFRHYLLGAPFKFFTNHSALKYLVNVKPVLEGRICRWLLLFQEFMFEVIVKLRKLNVGPDHLSHLETWERDGAIDDWLPDVDLFKIEAITDHLQLLLCSQQEIVHRTTPQCRKGISGQSSGLLTHSRTPLQNGF